MSKPTPAQQAEIIEQLAREYEGDYLHEEANALKSGAAALRAAVSPQEQIESAGDVTPAQAVEMLKVMGPVVEKAAIGYSANQFYAIAKAIQVRAAVSGEGKTCLTCRHSTPGEWCAQNVGRPYDASGFGCVRWEAMPAYDPAQHQTGAAPQEDSQ